MFFTSPEAIGAFALTSLVIELTPGPNMAYLAILSVGHGRRAGYAATAGIALGLFIIGMAAAFGLAALISSSPVLYEALRWGGVAYLLWLAWDGWRDAAETSPAHTASSDDNTAFFVRGLITNLLNPKAAVFFVVILPPFVNPQNVVLWQTIALSTIYVLIATTIHVVIVSLAGAARPFLENPKRNRLVRRILSGALAVIAAWFAFSSSR
jgi:threonine/homoserine/homoserine lactone efflux protein